MSRRKPSLRIGGGVVNRNSQYEKAVEKQYGLGLLGAYDNSDTDDGGDKTIEDDVNNANLDSKVADFLKEIDELDTEPAVTPSANEPHDQSTTPTILWGDWQQCVDENTKHQYYWNTTTNEVTWILPEEIAVQLQAHQQMISMREKQKNKAAVRNSTNPKNQNNIELKGKHGADVIYAADKRDPPGSHQESYLRENILDIDVDAELDQALELEKDKGSSNQKPVTEVDLELELLRRGKLPLINSEEENLQERFETEILALEESEELNRKAGLWKEYEEKVNRKYEEINVDKMKWRSNRLPELMKIAEKLYSHIDTSGEPKDTSIPSEDMFADETSDIPCNDIKTDGGEGIETNKKDNAIASYVADAVRLHENEVLLPTSANIGVQCGFYANITSSVSATDEETKVKIMDLSSNILDKMNFLEISKKAVTDFHILLIGIETRLQDWKEDALTSSHLLKKLQEAAKRLKHYEETATPPGWFCQWDRSVKRYYYKNKESGKMQWKYPEFQVDVDAGKKTDRAEEKEDSIQSERNEKDPKPEEKKQKKRKVDTIKQAESAIIKRCRSESPKSSTFEETSKNSPKNSEESKVTHDMYQYSGQNSGFTGYAQNYHMYGYHQIMMNSEQNRQMLCTSNDSARPPPPPGEEPSSVLDGPPPLPSEQPPPPPSSPPPPPDGDPDLECEGGEPVQEDDDGIVMEMSDGEIADEDKEISKSNTSFSSVMMQQAVLYKASNSMQPYILHPMTSTHASDATHTVPDTQLKLGNSVKNTKGSKIKQAKKNKKSAPLKKPPREMTSLVKQWQKAKEQIEEENRILEEEEEEEEDTVTMNKKEIEKWKQEQILSGKALTNSNFEPVPADWRTRILKKKTKQ